MFDTHKYNVGSKSIYAHVTEHRAPTDESVKILREMETVAREQVESTIRLETNEFKAVMHRRFDYLSNQMVYVVFTDLNGYRIKSEINCNSDEDKQETLIKIHKQVSEDIALYIVKSFVSI